MEAFAHLISNPLEAVINTITGEPATAVGPTELQGNATFTEDVLRMLIYNLYQGDSRLQQQVLQDYYHPDVNFSLNGELLNLHGRDELQQLLRGSQLLANYKPEILEISSSVDKAVILLDLHVSYKLLPLTWWAPLHILTTVTLEFADNPNPLAAAADYADLIKGHHQEMSLVDLLWWNPAWDWVNRRIWSRISGKTLAAFYRLEEPLVTKYVSYRNNGSGYFQSLLWSVEDIARAAGLEGLPSAAVKLNLIPPRTPSPVAAAAAPRAAAATPGLAVDSGLTEGPQTPDRDTTAVGFAGPASTTGAAAAAAAPRSILAQQSSSTASSAAAAGAALPPPKEPIVQPPPPPPAAAAVPPLKEPVLEQPPPPPAAAAAPAAAPAAAATPPPPKQPVVGSPPPFAAAAAALPPPRQPVVGRAPPSAAAAKEIQQTEEPEAGTASTTAAAAAAVGGGAGRPSAVSSIQEPKTTAVAPADTAEAASPAETVTEADVPKDLSAVKGVQSEPAAPAADVASLATAVEKVLQEKGDRSAVGATSAAGATSTAKVASARKDVGAGVDAGGVGAQAKEQAVAAQQQRPQLGQQGSTGGSKKIRRSGSTK